MTRPARYSIARRLWTWGRLIGIFLVDLTASALQVGQAILSRKQVYRSAIIAVPLDVRSDAGIMLLANLVTLTPGTTSIHVSEDRLTLYVHAMDATDHEGAIASIKNRFEAPILEVLP